MSRPWRVWTLAAALAVAVAGCGDDGGGAGTGDDAAPDVVDLADAPGEGPADVLAAELDVGPPDPVDPGPPPALEFQLVPFGGEEVVEITDLRFLPGTDDLLLLAKDGFLDHFRLEGDQATRLARVEVPGNYTHWECGLLGLTLDPDFATNGLIYVSHCSSITTGRVTRLTFTPDDPDAIPGSAVSILEAGDEDAEKPWHNIGSIGFDEGGYLWALFGDKLGKPNAQSTATPLGGMARVVPSREPGVGGHEPAPGNPWLDEEGADGAVYVLGLRSPWRGTRDDLGRIWVGDVGLDDFEEVNLVPPGGGGNYGWPDHEGACEDGCDGFLDPVTGYTHSDGDPYVIDDPEAVPTSERAIWLGPWVAGAPDDPYGGRLSGHALFGDFCVGFIRALAVDADGAVTRDLHVGHLENPTAGDVGPDGFVYVTTYGKCKASSGPESPGALYRAVPLD